MENTRICPRHKLQAHYMCTNENCYKEKDIIVCAECSGKHFQHQQDVISMGLLNEKVQDLMKKRMELDGMYEKLCEALITELKKFKVFKLQIFNLLNYREKCLNELCKRIKRCMAYEKDKQLFKKSLNYIHLSMRSVNPNKDLYFKFKQHISETIAQCKKCIYRLQDNIQEIPILMKKDVHIISVLKKVSDKPISPIQYTEPTFKQFKKQTVKFPQENNTDCKLYRLSNQQFLAYNKNSACIRWHHSESLALPRLYSMIRSIENLVIMDDKSFMTTENGGILIYDLLNDRLVKQYMSCKHKNAQITNLLALDQSHVVNFISCPNQIVCFQFHDEQQTLKMIKGIETNCRCYTTELFDTQFISSFDDKTVKLYQIEGLKKEQEICFDYMVKSLTKINEYSYVTAGESQLLSFIDKRVSGTVSLIKMDEWCRQVKKIYPYSIIATCGSKIKIMDIRMQKQVFQTDGSETIKYIEVLNPSVFLTSGKTLNLWKGVI